jgi:hypothetical protein
MPPDQTVSDEDSSSENPLDLSIENGILQGWKTNNHGAKEALRHGLLPTETVTGKAISALGEYRIKCLQRKYYRGIKSNRDTEKLQILNYAQDAIEALQPLELLINSDVDTEKINKAIEEVTGKLTKPEESEESEDKINDFIQEQKEYLNKLKDKITADDIQNIIKNQTAAIIQNAKSLNQYLTYEESDFAITRGYFHSCCENALKAVRDHQPDLNNRILPAHQGIYQYHKENREQDEHENNNERKIFIDLSRLNNDLEKVENALMAICKIEKKDNEITLEKAKTVTWYSTLDWFERSANIGKSLLNFIGGLTINLNPKKPYYPNKETEFSKKIQGIRIRTESLPIKLKNYSRDFLKSTLFDLLKLIALCYYNAFNLLNNIRNDTKNHPLINYFLPAKKENDSNQILEGMKSIEREPSYLNQLEEKITDFFKKLTNCNQPNSKSQENNQSQDEEMIFAKPSYHLTSFNDQAKDLFSFTIKMANNVIGGVTHNVYGENSFLGLIFTLTAAFGGLSVAAPQVIQHLLASKTIAEAATAPFIATGKTVGGEQLSTQIISAALVPAKLSSAIIDTFSDGTDSFIGTFANQLGNNPRNTALFILVAVSIGWMIPTLQTKMPITDTIQQKFPNLGGYGATNGLMALIRTGMEHPVDSKYIKELICSVIKDEEKSCQIYDKIKDFSPGQANKDENIIMSAAIFDILSKQQEINKTSYINRIRLYNKIRQFNDNRLTQWSYEILLRPKNLGLFSTTGNILFNHVTLLIRCLFALITFNGSATTWKELGNQVWSQLAYDYALVANATAITLHSLTDFIRALLSSFADVFFNNGFLQCRGISSRIKRSLGYETENSYDSFYEFGRKASIKSSELKTNADYWCGFFSGTNAARRKATEANGAFQKIIIKEATAAAAAAAA